MDEPFLTNATCSKSIYVLLVTSEQREQSTSIKHLGQSYLIISKTSSVQLNSNTLVL